MLHVDYNTLNRSWNEIVRLSSQDKYTRAGRGANGAEMVTLDEATHLFPHKCSVKLESRTGGDAVGNLNHFSTLSIFYG